MKAIEAILRGLGELRDPRFWGVAAKTIGATLALLIAAFWLAGWLFGVGGDAAFTLPWIGAVTVDGGVSLGLWIVLAIIGSAFLATPVAGLVVGLFLEEIVASVERRRYPGLPPATPAPLIQQIRAGVVLAATVLVANALALIVYIVAAPLAPLTFMLVNGWLIGREYVEMVALRRMSVAEVKAFKSRHRLPILLTGAACAAALAIPVVNLLAPLAGAAAATHLYHRIAAK